jgi:hypothetical protein
VLPILLKITIDGGTPAREKFWIVKRLGEQIGMNRTLSYRMGDSRLA